MPFEDVLKRQKLRERARQARDRGQVQNIDGTQTPTQPGAGLDANAEFDEATDFTLAAFATWNATW
jgi:hypothetical protein